MMWEILTNLDWGRIARGVLDTALVFAFIVIATRVFFRVRFQLRQRAWRKNPKVGDKAFFYNMAGGITMGSITHVYDDGQVRLESNNGNSSIPCKPDQLIYVTQEEHDYIKDKQLAATLKRLRRI